MTLYESNLGAINAARKQFGNEYRQFVIIEKLAVREWNIQIKQPLQASGIALETEREGAWAFPTAKSATDQGYAAFFFTSRNPEPEMGSESEEIVDLEDEENEDENAPSLAAQQAAADRIANAQASETTLNGKLWVRMSSVPKPTKRVWHIADELVAANPDITRKEVQDECVKRGIASGTARTQYQAWKKANDEAKAGAEKAAELSKRFNGN